MAQSMQVRAALLRMGKPGEEGEILPVGLDDAQIIGKPVVSSGCFGEQRRRVQAERVTDKHHPLRWCLLIGPRRLH